MAGRRTRSAARPGAGAGGRAAAVAVGLLIAGGLAVFDGLDPGSVVIGTVVLAPFVVAVLAGPGETGVIAGVAIALVLVSAAWNGNFLTAAYLLRVVVAVVGGAVAVLASRGRRDTAVDRERFALLAAIAEVADGQLRLEETAARVSELIVPRFADVSVLDVLGEGRLRRLAVRVAGPEAVAHEAWLRAREPSPSDRPGAAEAVAAGRARLLHPATEAVLRAGARDEADLERLRELRITAAIIVPLRARGRSIGALTLLTRRDSGRAYALADLEFVEVLAGRVALALDNAGLSTELQTIEAQLTTALGSLADAVTVQNRQGNLVYANEAAAGLLGFASAEELVATPPSEVAAGFDAFREDGSPLDMADLPGRRVLAGEEPEPLVVRAVDRRTNEEQWRLTKASAVRDSTGEITLVVNVITDITAAKRAEFSQRVLAEAGAALASSLDYERTLQQVADLAVPGLSDWCAVSLPDDRGDLATVAVAHVDPAKVSLAREIGARHPTSLTDPGGAAQVFRDGKPTSVNGITDEMLVAAAKDEAHLAGLRSLGMRAALIVPMTSSGRSVGVLSLVSAESGRSFGPDDVALAAELARRAATAVENARLYTERSTIARILQESLLPEPLPELPGWTAATLYRAAGDETSVGGDFYEGFAIVGGWMLVVGDVTGRGRRGSVPDRADAPHPAHGGDADRLGRRRPGRPEPVAPVAAGDVAVHGRVRRPARGRRPRVGRGHLRRAPAPGARARRPPGARRPVRSDPRRLRRRGLGTGRRRARRAGRARPLQRRRPRRGRPGRSIRPRTARAGADRVDDGRRRGRAHRRRPRRLPGRRAGRRHGDPRGRARAGREARRHPTGRR